MEGVVSYTNKWRGIGMRQMTFSQEFMRQVLQNLTNTAYAVEKDSRKFTELQRLLTENQKTLQAGVDQYNKDRIAQVKEELVLRGLTWCTSCNTVAPISEVRFQLTQGRSRRKWGEDQYYYQDYSVLHRACSACYAHQEAKHGYVGEYDTLVKGQTFCFVFFVEKRDDDYYALEFGGYVKLEDARCVLGDIAPETVERQAAEWNLTPRVGIVDGKFIVYSPVTTAASEAA